MDFFLESCLPRKVQDDTTPIEHEMMMGDWVVRNAIARGTFGHVYAVTHARTGKAAAAKDL
jgi:hypothetical protein